LATAPFVHPRQLVKDILKTEPDAVVWYGSAFSPLYLSQLRALKKPLIWDIDTDIYGLQFLSRYPKRELLDPKNSMLQFVISAVLGQHLIRRVANSAFIAKVVVPNRHLKDVLCSKGVDPEKIAVIPSTIENISLPPESQTSVAVRQKLGLNPDEYIVSYFGAPQMSRGPDIAILSTKKVLEEQKKFKLLIFSRRKLNSNTPEDQYYKQKEQHLQSLQNQLNTGAHIQIIPGFLDKQIVQQYMQASDVIVLPFRMVPSEPPLSMFEVMASGKAVVTSNLGGLQEIVGQDRGLVVAPGDANALGEALLFLAKNPDQKAALGRNAQRFAQALPTWNQVADQFLEVLQAAVEGARKV
jgi:glycosyltransferase involved in cell wall biosynthesis